MPEIFQAPQKLSPRLNTLIDETLKEQSLSDDSSDNDSVSIIDITDDKLPKSLKRMNRTKLVRSGSE